MLADMSIRDPLAALGPPRALRLQFVILKTIIIYVKRVVLSLALLASACGPGENLALPQCPGEIVCTVEDEETGLNISVVHAPEKDFPTLYAFTSPDDQVDTDAWDLAFGRTSILVNGGISGDAEVEVAMLKNVSLVDLGPDDVPSEGWFTDESSELAFEREDKWYVYDLGRHVVEVRPRVYFVRVADGTVYGVEFISYYDYTGSPRHVTFRWADMSAIDNGEPEPEPEPDPGSESP